MRSSTIELINNEATKSRLLTVDHPANARKGLTETHTAKIVLPVMRHYVPLLSNQKLKIDYR